MKTLYEYNYDLLTECKQKNPANICLFKVNSRNFRKRCEICSKVTMKTPTMCEKYPNTGFCLVRIFLYSEWMRRFPNTSKYGPEKTLYLDTFHALQSDFIEGVFEHISLIFLMFLLLTLNRQMFACYCHQIGTVVGTYSYAEKRVGSILVQSNWHVLKIIKIIL